MHLVFPCLFKNYKEIIIGFTIQQKYTTAICNINIFDQKLSVQIYEYNIISKIKNVYTFEYLCVQRYLFIVFSIIH